MSEVKTELTNPEKFLKEYSDLERQYNNVEISFDGLCKMLEAYKNQFTQEVSEFEREKIRQITIHECKEELLKHLFLMTHQNSYPAKAVPQATILELEALMRSKLTGK